MNHQVKRKLPYLFVVLGLTVLFFSQCCKKCKDKEKEDCCEGYTGTVTDSSSLNLLNQCHFIEKDSIDSWTARYQANKNLICNDTLPTAINVLGDSSSFNRCIIKAIICNDSCIGLRVVYGMDIALKVHVILVGIKPDYSTLYIPRPGECCPPLTMAKGVSGGGGGGPLGGAEYSLMP
jgi:hypothetical protein